MEEVKQRDLYNKIDKNRDGKIDIKDLSTALSEMEVAQLPGHALC
jgi:Ca2+-binding EF-hand superfamily protein